MKTKKIVCAILLVVNGNPSNFRIEEKKYAADHVTLVLPTSSVSWILLEVLTFSQFWLKLREKELLLLFSLCHSFLSFCYRKITHTQGFNHQVSECHKLIREWYQFPYLLTEPICLLSWWEWQIIILLFF